VIVRRVDQTWYARAAVKTLWKWLIFGVDPDPDVDQFFVIP